MRVQSIPTTKQNQNKPQNFKGTLINVLPEKYLKDFDPLDQLSSKELKRVVNYVNFIKTTFAKAVKNLTPKDDFYTLGAGHQGGINVYYKPGAESERKGLREGFVTSLTKADASRRFSKASVEIEKVRAMAHFPKKENVIAKGIKTLFQNFKKQQIANNKTKAAKLREKSFN